MDGVPQQFEFEQAHEEFEHEEASADREAGPTLFAEPGLPDNLEEIRQSEIDFSSFGKVRTLTETQSMPSDVYDPMSEVYTNQGASLVVVPGMFAGAQAPVATQLAPPMPFYLEPGPKSFHVARALAPLRRDLEAAFAAGGVEWGASAESPCGFACTAFALGGEVPFACDVFASGSIPSGHLVDFRHLGGCRYAFAQVAAGLAAHLKVAFPGGGLAAPLPFAPPPLSAAFLALPVPAPKRAAPAAPDGEAATLAYLGELLAADAPRALQRQGARAAGALATADPRFAAAAGGSSAVGARLAQLAGDAELDPATRAAGFAALAAVCGGGGGGAWLEAAAVPAAVRGCQDGAHHVKREALRCVEALARQRGLAAPLVRGGVVPLLEAEAGGGDGCRDDGAVRFAESALRLIRA
jgi:hypothetical protein